MSLNVLITGHNGYLGSVMAPRFLAAGHRVTGLDTGYFAECTLVEDRSRVPAIPKDLRELSPGDLEGFDAVVHLAALSNDPIGNLNDDWTDQINHRASARLAELARAAGVGRFLFSSSCIMYGAADAAVVDEESPLDPRTCYARSKVLAERAIARLATDDFSPVFLRNGTVYGLSPRMRFDTVLNNLVGSAVATGKVLVLSDGKPWRPVVHVEDVADAFLAALEAPRERLHNQAINTGADSANHQILDLARMVVQIVPGCTLECLARPGADQRTYRTSFSRIARLLPDFRLRWPPREGIARLAEEFRRLGLDERAFTDPRFTRLRWLAHLRETGRLDGDLRWGEAADRVPAGMARDA